MSQILMLNCLGLNEVLASLDEQRLFVAFLVSLSSAEVNTHLIRCMTEMIVMNAVVYLNFQETLR